MYRMEDVLEVYTRPYDPSFPQVCLDEASKQLLGETRDPIRAAPGRTERYDHEYVRGGVASLFMLSEPLAGWRHVEVSETRTRKDWARVVRWLVDERYPDAVRVVLVEDNLNTHTPTSLYEAYEPTEARRILERLELHYTPKHGSWLNMAEIELSAMGRQCLDRRIENREELEREVAAWEAERNGEDTGIDWRFTTDDARIKLKHLYPSIEG